MRWIGDLSYSVYLWHWPLLVLGTFLVGGDLNPWLGVAIVALSFVPAWLSYRFIETPFRDWKLLKQRVGRALQVGLVCMIISAMVGAILIAVPTLRTASADDAVGAKALVEDPLAAEPVDEASVFAPSFGDVADDLPKMYEEGCHESSESAVDEPCVYGDPDSDTTVALVGDSHAAQWFPALEPIAAEYGWKLVIYTKSSCPLVDAPLLDHREHANEGCEAWNARVQDALTGSDKPDYAIVSSYGYETVDGSDYADGLAEAWRDVMDAGVDLTVLVDPPAAGIDVPECVATNLESLTSCTLPQSHGNTGGADAQLEAATEVDATTIDMTEFVCPEERCSPIIGDVLTFRDQHHLTATYVATLVEPLSEALAEESTLPLE